MQAPNNRIAFLIIHHLKDDLTVEQQIELQEWIDHSEANQAIFNELTDPDKLNEKLKAIHEAKTNTWDKVEAGIKTPVFIEGAVHAIRPIRRQLRIYIAAAALLIFVITGYFWLNSQLRSPSKARPAELPVAGRDVAPGGDKATLTLANGSTIVLENAANGSLTVQGATHVSKNKHQLAYTAEGNSGKILYNTLTTPRAGQYQLLLPDGTRVWLNNASSLRYPTDFTGASREVELTGEAYFEVAKNTSQPFFVRVPGATVQVLGTSFNVMAYADEPVVKATLLTGKVSIASADKQSILSPGEQSIVNHVGEISILKGVDTDEVIAWQRGFFHFVHANLDDALRQLARWYDVEVDYRIAVPEDYTFDGEIGRNLSLIAILKHMEKKDVHFTVEGKKLIVSR